MSSLTPGTAPAVEPRALRHLDALFSHIDRRIAHTIKAGADDRSYLLRVGIPRVDLTSGGAVKQQRSRHIPLDVPQRARLLVTVDQRLRAPARPAPVSPTCATERANFVNSIPHPRQEGVSQSVPPGL